MTTVSILTQVTLKAQPEEVFNYVSDLTRHPEWSGGPLNIESVSATPIGVGSQYRSWGGSKERLNELRVTAYDPPTRFAFIAKDARVGEIVHEFSFKPQAGQTLMERKVTGTFPPLAALLFRFLIYPRQGKPLMEKAMAKLKAKWESHAQ